ncbi:MAG: hypothetical protein KAV82_11000, partial [Phycisphaerae bacterium]|nr:hypothetical protein [Phycisphaerae bacterium]
MRTIKLFAIVLVICTAGCMDSEAVRSVLSGTPLSSADNRSDELTVGDVNKPQRDPNEPTATSEGGSQQAMPAAGFIQAQVRNTSGRSAKVSIRFLMNDLEVHFTRLRVRSQRETFMIGPELAQIIEFSGTDATGATLPPAIFVFGDNVDEDNPAIYVIADSGEQEPEQPIDDPQEDQDDQQTPDQPDEEESTEPEEEEEEEEEEPASPPGGGGGGQQPPPITDCNQNGVPDEHDILHGTSQDCNSNAVPDECDIAAGTSSDVNGNAVPDECEPDCNTNGVPDYLDILHGTSQNCNANSVPDECDIQAGTSTDVNGNAVPDECEPDCNANGVPDDLDIQCGTSHDCNTNSIPDECDIA